jgi:hypothetical protein
VQSSTTAGQRVDVLNAPSVHGDGEGHKSRAAKLCLRKCRGAMAGEAAHHPERARSGPEPARLTAIAMASTVLARGHAKGAELTGTL